MARAARKQTPANDTPPAAKDHNQGLSSDQELCLALRHCRTYEGIIERKKLIRSEEMNFGKVLKVDFGDNGLDQIKIMIQRKTPEGKAKVDAKLASMRKAISWSAGEDGQFEMFAEKKPQGESPAFVEGKISAMDGEALRNPYGAGTADHEDYGLGFQRGEIVFKEMNERLAVPAAELVEGAGHDGDLDDEEQD